MLRSTETVFPRLLPSIPNVRRGTRSGLPSPFERSADRDRVRAASGSVVELGPEAAVRPCSGARRPCALRGTWSPGPPCGRRCTGRQSRPNKGRDRLGSRASPGRCRRPCSGARRGCSRRSSRSPGPACGRRSGRRSQPRRSAAGSVVALGLEAAVAPVQEHGDGPPGLSSGPTFAIARSRLRSPFRSPIASE